MTIEEKYKKDIKKILDISFTHKVSHIPSALSQMIEFKYLIPKVKDRINPDTIDLIILNGKNPEFKYVEETLGNALGVTIGLALTQTKPIWLNVSDSIFQMGRVLEALPLLSKFNSNILITVDFNNISRSKKDLYTSQHISKLAEINNIPVINISSENPNLQAIDELIELSGPRMIVFETIKGFGVNRFKEDPVGWHYKTMSEEEYKEILEEL